MDPFGNVLRSVAIGYGRRHDDPDPLLTAEDRARQHKTHVTVSESGYTNPIVDDDAYRAPLPAEARTFELIKVTPGGTVPNITNLFGFDEMAGKVARAGDGNHDLPYENVRAQGASEAHPYRRLIAQVRTLYRPDDMGIAAGDAQALLPLGQLDSRALPGTSYTLAFTPGFLSRIYRRGQETLLPTPASVLGGTGPDHGGYVDVAGNGHWWVPSGRVFYHPGAAATPQEEEEEARHHFFLARRFEDPFGNPTVVDYHAPHHLLVAQVTDAKGNLRVAVNDYRVLSPKLNIAIA